MTKKMSNFFQGFSKKEEPTALPEEPCEHIWKLTIKTFAPPIKNLQAKIEDSKLMEKAMFGVTTYLWECQSCGETKKEEVLGSDENQLAELLEKVDKFGMQYIREGTEVYAIAKWVPETSTDSLPIR
jgi:hypothetical protein